MKKKAIPGSIIFLLFLVFFLVPGCDDFSLLEVLANDIALIPEEITLNLDETIEFSVTSGISPFIFTETGDGTISSSLYTAPGVPGNFTVTVKDDRNRTAEAFVTVVDAITIVPEIVSTGIGGVIQFTISGGTGSYNFDWDPLLGNYDSGTDTYTAGGTAGIDVITVTDSAGQIAEASVTIIDTSNLMIIPEVAEVLIDDIFTFSASGGTGPGTYTFSVLSGNGSIDVVNGKYTAPSETGNATVRVTDTDSATADATIYIVAELLTINPSISLTLYVGDEFSFSASNGNSPYSFSILGDEPSGSINSSTGLFTALAKDNSVTVIVTDKNGNTDTCRVKIKS